MACFNTQTRLIPFSCLGSLVSGHACDNTKINPEHFLFPAHHSLAGAEISLVNNTTKASFHFIKEPGNRLVCVGSPGQSSVTVCVLCSSVFGFVDSGRPEIHNPAEEGKVWGTPVQQETFFPGRSILHAFPCLRCVKVHPGETSWLCVFGQSAGLLWASVS